MADSERLPHSECLRCKAYDSAMPQDALLRALINEDWSPADADFLPRPMTQEQAVAAELLTRAIGPFIKAFGIETAGARLNYTLQMLRGQARYARAVQRTLNARADINARAREQYERCDYDAAHAIEAEPTPDYPQRVQDEKLMGVAHG